MDKQITLQLTDAQYKHLMEMYHLGYLTEDHINHKSDKQILDGMNFMIALSKQGYDCGSKNALMEDGIYSITQEMETNVHDIFEQYREYVESGEAEADDEAIRKQIEQFEKEQRKKK